MFIMEPELLEHVLGVKDKLDYFLFISPAVDVTEVEIQIRMMASSIHSIADAAVALGDRMEEKIDFYFWMGGKSDQESQKVEDT